MAISMQDLYTQSPGIKEAQKVDAPTASTAGTQTRDAVASKVETPTAAADGSLSGTGMGQVSEERLASVQAADITGQDSPLMQRARQQGMLEAGRRGLQNTSIAVGAAQGAMADRAIPLAQQDAATFNQQAMQNQAMQQEAAMLNAQLETAVNQGNAAAANAAKQQLADLQTRASMQGAEMAQQTELSNVQAENQMRATVLQQNADLNKQFLAGTQAMDLATIQGQYNQLISTNETAARLYDSYFNSISQAMANKDIAPDRIAQYVNVQQSMLEAGLRMMDQMNALNLDTSLPGVYSTQTGRFGGQKTIEVGEAPPPPEPVAEPAPAPEPEPTGGLFRFRQG